MNKVALSGRLTRDPDVRYSQGDSSLAIARFTLAANKLKRKEEEQTADFIPCIAFGKTAEICEKYCKQGTKLIVEGRIQTGKYNDREGLTRYSIGVVISHLEFCEKKLDGSDKVVGKEIPEEISTDIEGFMQIAGSIEDVLPFS